MAAGSDETRLQISRAASHLFLERGIAAVNGFDIAAAAGVSKRTLWRYFRTKESCVEPILSQMTLLFVAQLLRWPRDQSIEQFLGDQKWLSGLNRDDRILAARILSKLPEQPALRSAWLMACRAAEEQWIEIIGGRLDPAIDPLRVRVCAAAIMGGLRVFDEQACYETFQQGRKYSFDEAVAEFCAVVREVGTLPICDAVG